MAIALLFSQAPMNLPNSYPKMIIYYASGKTLELHGAALAGGQLEEVYAVINAKAA